jgi:hypothetical protein
VRNWIASELRSKALHRDKRKLYSLPYKVANGLLPNPYVDVSQVDQTRSEQKRRERTGAATAARTSGPRRGRCTRA